MDEWILSFEIGVKKPDAGIYKMIFEKMDVAGNEVFYIDDIEQYVDTARALGIKGMVFKNADQLWKEIGDIVENKRQ
jgi:HAD superfamily hydrolase (TIGR01509 family)